MNRWKSNLIVVAAIAASSGSAVAQTRFCLGGDLAHLSTAERASCSAKLEAAKADLAALHAPENWHFVMVCGESGWKSYTAFLGNAHSSIQDASANTVLEESETFLRSDKLNLGEPSALHSILAHEVEGILLHRKSEPAIAD